MRVLVKFLIPLATFALFSCQPVRTAAISKARPAPQQDIPISPQAVLAPVVESQAPATSPHLLRKTIAGITFEGVSYDSRSHRLRVIDQADGPGTRYVTTQDLAQKTNALLAINAGFFTPEGAPLGLVISEGKTSGGWNSASSLGSGIFRETSGGTASIVRRTSRSDVSGARELLQAGPLLIENGKIVFGLETQKIAVRSIILSDGQSRWWIGITSPCSLSALAQAVSQTSPAPWKVKMALNLDGGRSTDLFVSEKVSGGPHNRRGFLNRPVRNFLILEEM